MLALMGVIIKPFAVITQSLVNRSSCEIPTAPSLAQVHRRAPQKYTAYGNWQLVTPFIYNIPVHGITTNNVSVSENDYREIYLYIKFLQSKDHTS